VRPSRTSASAPAILALALAGCFVHAEPPASAPDDARGGHAPPRFDAARACGSWASAVGPGGDAARSHVSFPELDPRACFVPVRYGAGGPRPDPTPTGCGYPGEGARARVESARRIAERIAGGHAEGPLPIELACALPDETRRAAARQNARTLTRLLARLDRGERFPYAAVATFGFGSPAQDASALVAFRPGDACPALGKRDMDLFGVNITRAFRAAEARLAQVAPVIVVSGGAVHAALDEAFLLTYLTRCRFGVAPDEILVDPCAAHTHENLRNTAAIVEAIGGRTAYVVTDDGLQSGYLEEWNSFHLLGGSLDQRSLRDFGYLIGSWRRASVGMPAGFWLTPFRFWAEPPSGLGSFTCAGR